jgi:hypothetical protein
MKSQLHNLVGNHLRVQLLSALPSTICPTISPTVWLSLNRTNYSTLNYAQQATFTVSIYRAITTPYQSSDEATILKTIDATIFPTNSYAFGAAINATDLSTVNAT